MIIPWRFQKQSILLFFLFAFAFFRSGHAESAKGNSDFPFKADKTHDVAVLEACDLAVRFNKRSVAPITLFVNTSRPPFFHEEALGSFQIYEDVSQSDANLGPGGPAKITLECFDPTHITNKGGELFTPLFEKKNQWDEVPADAEETCQNVGLDPLDCEEMEEVRTFKATDKENGIPYVIYLWRINDISYLFSRRNDPGKRIHLEMRINSNHPSTSSLDLTDPTYTYYHW